MNIAVVLNPAAGGGRPGRNWPAIAGELKRHFGSFEVEATRAPGDASALAARMAARGAEMVIAVGGDGTVSEVADGLLRSRGGGRHMPALAVIPAGTGSDFARSLAIPRDIAPCVRQIAEGPSCTIDAGRITFAGNPMVRHFVSVASVGVSGAIAAAVNRASAKRSGRMPARALFFVYTLRELARGRFHEVSIAIDGAPAISRRIALVAVANNAYFGGGMMIAPDARADDGRLEVVVVRGSSRMELIRDLFLVYSGSHRNHPSCTFLSGRRIEIFAGDAAAQPAAPLEIDGEPFGAIPVAFEILERALVLRGAGRTRAAQGHAASANGVSGSQT